MSRLLTLVYSFVCYALFNLTFLYLAGFLLEVFVPKTINSGEVVHWTRATAINLALIALFGATHSIMARDWFKRWWTTFVPEIAERSTYVLQSSIFLALAIWQWQPMPWTVWQVEGDAAWVFYAAFGGAAVLLLWSTFLIDHFELFGLRQAWCYWRGVAMPKPQFRTPALYRIVRHPMQLGITIMFLATPHMTVGHLLFASAMIAYIMIGLYFEERSLVRHFGDDYRTYQSRVPMLIPLLHLGRARPLSAT
ncbi:MAG: methanethiol S-methyltransferase [Geminicoccaceae bacterium]